MAQIRVYLSHILVFGDFFTQRTRRSAEGNGGFWGDYHAEGQRARRESVDDGEGCSRQ